MFVRITLCALLTATVAGCGRDYSPNTYASNAVQQANKAEQGVIVAVREVGASGSGTVGAMMGGAAGGIAGSTAEHIVGDTRAFEYIVRKTNGHLVSVTQNDTKPLAIGQKVLVITGNQARVVADHTVPAEPGAKEKPPEPAMPATAPPPKGADAPKVETAP